MFAHTSRGVADSGAGRGDLGDGSRVVRPRCPTNLDLKVTVRVDLLHTAYLAQGLFRNVVTNSLVYEGLLSLGYVLCNTICKWQRTDEEGLQ